LIIDFAIVGLLFTVLELCEKGSLKKELDTLRSGEYKIIDHHQQTQILKDRVKLKHLLQMLLRWCKQVASGMEHLENLSVKERFALSFF